MKAHEKIRIFREINQLSQEDVATQLNMSSGGYAKIERGETNLHIDKLQKIAQIFNVNARDLLDDTQTDIFINIGDNVHNYNNLKNNSNSELSYEIQKLNLIIQHKDEMIHQLKNEIETLKVALNQLNNR
ncbi:helix-turn-helix domain-containing protein [Moraxella sp. ZY210820]|uniref:helix-turn-helix domain-containing protein n=1 Tax=unclassified Moraxella TaxID=2685852 RepID=UPI00273173F3|nr:helix-turn-helix transcriptional regulator [Moraxella sp. ZY210820]WLF83952.1 helix-turn-helix domain-containing protein [Moraxella sp. ZY210820]